MSSVQVTKALPVVVRPSELELGSPPPRSDTTTTTVALSPFDRLVPPIPVTSLLVFDRPIAEPVETIKQALSRALAHYRPIAGRLDGGGGIACTDEGVTFVGASASCCLQEAMAADLHRMDDLAVLYPGLLCRDADPLLLLQVTEFTCGGFVVAATANHVVADGAGMAQFLQAVAELARGVTPPSRFPIRSWAASLPVQSLPASAIAAHKSRAQHEPEQHRLARLDVVVPAVLIARIRAAEPCTVLEAVMAVLWRCRTRAAMAMSPGGDGAECPAPLTFACNMRAYVGVPAGYYGNCIRAQVVEATAGAVAGGSVGHLVRLIRRAKEKIPDLLLSSRDQAQPRSYHYQAFSVTDWRYVGLDAMDFGSGVPAQVLWHAKQTMQPCCVVCPPRRDGSGGGVDVSSLFLKPDHVDSFLGELARLAASAE